MRRVEFLVAGSPNEAFFSQIAANRLSIFNQHWARWQPSFRCIFGGEPDWPALALWMPQLSDIDVYFLSTQRFNLDSYFAQSEHRLNPSTDEVDVFVLLDADTFVTGDIEEILDQVHAQQTIAGVQAHFGFPVGDGRSNSSVRDWQKLAELLLEKPMRLDYYYSMVPESFSLEERSAPFYINAGVILISGEIISHFRKAYRSFRRRVMPLLANPYFSGQVAITLAVEELDLNPLSLPIRFNFPNDPSADAMYPQDLVDIRILHFLRHKAFDRTKIFSSSEYYQSFLDLPLKGSNKVFQNRVRETLGGSYPFGNRIERIQWLVAQLERDNDVRVVSKTEDERRHKVFEETHRKFDEVKSQLNEVKEQHSRTLQNLEHLQQSLSWRITAPARRAAAIWRHLRK